MDDYDQEWATATCSTETAPVMICLLGDFRLLQAGILAPIRAGSKSEALLTYLGLQYNRRVPRERLIQALWPHSDLALALNSLNNLVYTLHRQLGPALAGATPVLHGEGYYRLNMEAGIVVDVACFDQLVEAGDQHNRAGSTAAAVDAYRNAATLYRDDLSLLADQQMVVERERLRARYLTLLTQLAEHYYCAGDYTSAFDYLWRLLARDSCREDAHRLLMQCYVRRGERASALRHYAICVELLRNELDVTPERATVELYESIRA